MKQRIDAVDKINDRNRTDIDQNDSALLAIYISEHCAIAIQKSFVPFSHWRMWYKTFLGNYICAYSHEVAESISRLFPKITVSLMDIHATDQVIPETVFATPMYLLNGRVWSLGNPSPEKIMETLQDFK